MATAIPVLTDRRQFVADIVAKCVRGGATHAEAVYHEGDEFNTRVRLGEVEELTESGSRALGVRVLLAADGGFRTATASTSDLSPDGVAQLVSGALELVRVTSTDPFAGLPDDEDFGQHTEDQGLYYGDVYSLPPAERIDMARRAEAAAMQADPRIQNSGGGTFSATTGNKAMANSRGFAGEYRRSYCGISARPIAQDASGAMQRDSWYSSARSLTKLDTPEEVGAEAARRALQRLGARKVVTQRVPIVFDRENAADLMGELFGAANGDTIYRGASFLAGALGHQIAAENVTLIDDGTLYGGFGTTPFDGEGLITRRKAVVERGVLQHYLLNTYVGRKLNMRSTGNASRGLAGTPGIGAGNVYLEPGTQTPQEIIAGVKSGFYVTEMLGHGGNVVTGDFSQGASGMWIENGELAYPVEEVTIAGNLKDIFRNIVAIGNDLQWRSSVAVPTLRVEGMTVAGA